MREISNHFDTLTSIAPERLTVNTEVVIIARGGDVYLFEKGSQVNVLYLKAARLDSQVPSRRRRISTSAIVIGKAWTTTDANGSGWILDISALFCAKQSQPVLPLRVTLDVINREYDTDLIALDMLSSVR